MAELKRVSCERTENEAIVKAEGKRRGRCKAITVTYANEMPVGALEQALAGIYARKVKNGTLAL